MTKHKAVKNDDGSYSFQEIAATYSAPENDRNMALCKLAHKARAIKALSTLCNAMYHGDLTMVDLTCAVSTEIASLEDKIEDLRKARAMISCLDR